MKKIQFDQQKETPHPKKKINKKKKTAKKWKVIELEKNLKGKKVEHLWKLVDQDL